MYAVASLLDPAADQAVQSLWSQFELRCGLISVKQAPFPHFSWLGAESYAIDPLQDALTRLARTQQPFRVRTAGLGVFTGPQPVVYIALVKDATLLSVHTELWNQLQGYATLANSHYDPDRWMPHITLALRDLSIDRLACAMAQIANQPLELEIMVDHFAVLYHLDGTAGIHSRYNFSRSGEKAGGPF